MSRMSLGFLMTLLCISCSLYAQPDRIVVGGGQFQPMLFVAENGQVVGRDVDLWKLWAQKTGVSVEFKLMDWADVIPALLRHEVDVVDGASFTPERAKQMDFTEPYQELYAYAFYQERGKSVQDLTDLKGLTVGVVAGTNVEEYLRGNVPEAHLMPFRDHKALITGALAGRVTVFLSEGAMTSYYFNQAGGAGGFRRSTNPFVRAELRMAVRRDEAALLDLLRTGFAKIPDEERRKLDETWFGVDWLSAHSRFHSLRSLVFLGIAIMLAGWAALARTWYRERTDIRAVRDAFINLWLVSSLLFAPFILGASILRSVDSGWTYVQSVHIGIAILLSLVAIFRHKLSYRLRTSVFLGSMVIVAMTGLLGYGLIGPTILTLLLLVVTAVTLFGTYGGIMSTVVSLALLGAVGLAVQTGIWTYSYDIAAYAQSSTLWVYTFATFGFAMILISSGIGGVYKHMEGALAKQRESELRFRTLVENIPGVNYRCALDEDWTMEFISNEIETLSGYPVSDFLQNQVRSYTSIIHAEDRQYHRDTVLRAVAQKEVFTFEYRIVRADGELRWLLERGQAVFLDDGQGTCLDGVIVDVTDHKRAEESLQRSERNYREIFNSANDALFLHDADTGRILDVNDTMLRLYGYDSKQDILAGNVGDVSANEPPYTEEEAQRRIHLATQEGPQIFEWLARKSNGDRFWVEVSLRSSQIDGHGRILAAVRDITERKRLEEQFRQAQKMEAVGQLAGGIAHDFNNLLHVILGNLELISSDEKSNTQAWERLEDVRISAERAVELVRQLLLFSRRQAMHPINVDLNELIQGVLKMLRRVIGEHIELHFAGGEHLDAVFVDKGQMEQVLMNLCVNARDAMAHGGTLTIRTENTTLDADYCRDHSWAAEGRYVLVRVTDTGHGMNTETLTHIFEPFFTTKEVGQGTGLGLATVYGIVKQHNGLIRVNSEPDVGTEFGLYLPTVERSTDKIVDKQEPLGGGGTDTVLVAEDEPSLLKLTAQILHDAGYAVLTASDGKEALRVFEEHAEVIDLVLLDVIMPGLGGREVMEQIQTKYSGVAFLFSSGYGESVIPPDFALREGLRLLRKPYHRNDLLREVRQSLDARRGKEG